MKNGHGRPDTVRLRVPADIDPAAILEQAERAGRVTSFTFGPPELSEVFLSAVAGR